MIHSFSLSFARRSGTSIALALLLTAPRLTDAGVLVTGVDVTNGGPPTVGVFKTPSIAPVTSFSAFSANFVGGVRVAARDFNSDTVPDIVAASGPGAASTVRLFDGATFAPVGGPLGNFSPFAVGYTGGTYVAAGDLNGDGKADIVVGSGGNTMAAVRAFSGADGSTIANFFPYGGFTGGVRVAVGDVNGDGKADIITAPASGIGTNVRVFNAANAAIISSFDAYSPSYTGGGFVAAGDVDGDGLADLVVGPDIGAAPNVRVFDGGNPSNVLKNFFAFDPAFTGGVRVAAGDVNGDGLADLVAAQGPGGTAQVRGFGAVDLASLVNFNPYGTAFNGGAFVALPEPSLALSAFAALALNLARRPSA